MQIVNKNGSAVCVLWKLGSGVTYVTNATSEQIKVGTALTLCVLPNLGPDQMWAHITGFIYSKNNTTLHRHGSTITYTYTYLSSVIVSCRIVAVVQWVSSAPVRIVVSDELAHCRIVMIPRRQEIVDFCR